MQAPTATIPAMKRFRAAMIPRLVGRSEATVWTEINVLSTPILTGTTAASFLAPFRV